MVFGKGRARLEVSPTVREHVERMLAQSAPRTMETLRRVTKELRDQAAAEWPVKTGRSRAGLETEIRMVGGGIIEGVVFNRVPYAYKITLPGAASWDKRDHVWSNLVRKPGKERAPEVVKALADDMLALAAGR